MNNFKKIDILVNNVGFDSVHPFVNTTPDFWRTIIEINYKSVLNTVRTVLPIMINQGFGVIINIGSDAGRVGERYEAVYSGAKGAVISFSKAVAREVGRHGVRINVVCPGGTVPENPAEIGERSMWVTGVTTSEQLEKSKKFYALGRLGKPEDVAAAVLFLASEKASFITGQTLSVSGGYSMI
jgi:NAD(P)-dependent dehydrogenase (short-subunit alcohol dehydrogenase family)